MKLISLTQGLFAKVDDADYAATSAFKWLAIRQRGGFYAGRRVRVAVNKQKTLKLHNFLLPGGKVDHKDGDGLNCQRDNLRSATTMQNAWAFQRKSKGASSEFRGVSWNRSQEKWKAQICCAGKRLSLGHFKDEREAALAYDAAARHYFGEFASPNFTTNKTP